MDQILFIAPSQSSASMAKDNYAERSGRKSGGLGHSKKM